MEKVFASLVYIRPPVTPVDRPRFGLKVLLTGYPVGYTMELNKVGVAVIPPKPVIFLFMGWLRMMPVGADK